MPTYEYKCANGHVFERFQRMTEPPIGTCPECGAAAERLLSAGVGLLFKGSGFYITDYRSESYKKAAEAESGTSGEKKPADSKPAEGGSKPADGESKKSADAAEGGAGPTKSSGGE